MVLDKKIIKIPFIGNKWQKRRKILTPAFHFNVLKKYMDIIADNSEKVVESLKLNQTKENVQNLLQFTTNYTLNVICGKNLLSILQNYYLISYHHKMVIKMFKIDIIKSRLFTEAAMGTPLHGIKEVQTKYRNAIHVMGDVVVYR